jgi:hypothetical protein
MLHSQLHFLIHFVRPTFSVNLQSAQVEVKLALVVHALLREASIQGRIEIGRCFVEVGYNLHGCDAIAAVE